MVIIKMMITKDDWCILRWGDSAAGVSSNNSNLVESSAPQSICIAFIIGFDIRFIIIIKTS